jgi:hypothetical protein
MSVENEMPLTATIEAPAGQTDVGAFQVLLRITNQSDRTVTVLNPDMGIPAPTMKWPWSREVYQTSMLMSFGYLSISVTDETGKELPQQTIQAWATPVLQPKIELEQGDSFELAIPIGSFYQLASGRVYLVVIEYGDRDLKVVARTSVTARRES